MEATSKEKTTLMQASKSDVLAALDKAMKEYKVAALTKKGDKLLYDFINSSKEVEWEYTPTVLSPKKFFFPQEEVLLEYTPDGKKIETKIEASPVLLFGIRPCDLNSIKILDEAFASGTGDPNYMSKREKSLVIGLDCSKLCDERAFCYRVKSNYSSKGYDIFIQDLGSDFAITVRTDKGKKFVNKYLETKNVDKTAVNKFEDAKKKTFSKVGPLKNLDKLPELFEQHKGNLIWKEEAAKCLSCGSCILVCPTCYCFDIADELTLNLKEGQRLRRWDACMLNNFAVVAGGENFRKTTEERLKHRIMRKFNYLMKKHGQSVCVGCGRCVRACLAEISPKTIAKVITGDAKE